MTHPIRLFLVDDEQLALTRLSRLLGEDARVEIVGLECDPQTALSRLSEATDDVDALFLDIQMPGLNGFELLARLEHQPLVVFTTAYDEYALRAFEVNSIDYLLKPIEAAQLDRAISKLTRLMTLSPTHIERAQPDFNSVLSQLANSLQQQSRGFATRIASRSGERIRLLELTQVTHFFAQDKLTYAATSEGNFSVDRTVAELELELDPTRFVRIHRAVLLNLDFIDELHTWFGGRLMVRLKDASRTELTVARDRVKALKDRLGF